MEFFNKKEDVVDVQLTQYGKLLLAKGILKPVYYAFFDDNIIYDAQAAGTAEEINSIEDRIKEASYPKTQYVFHGVETQFKAENTRLSNNNLKDSESVEYIPSPYERNNALRYSLGNSEIGNDTVPLSTVNALNGKFSPSELTFYTGTSSPLPIPQLESQIIYEIVPHDPPPGFVADTGQYTREILTNQDLLDSKIDFFNGASISINGHGLFVEFLEDNSAFNDENFELEIYEVIPPRDSNGDGENDIPEELLQLYFSDPEGREERLVKSYFEILFDDEVGEERLLLTSKRKLGTFVSDPRPSDRGLNSQNQDIYTIPDGPSGLPGGHDAEVDDCFDDEESE